ncbi:hypothetical protein ADL28_31175 [Streptomyces violaceusniger]|uniref:Uncharacterized protein n=1 Tax=Streptomyces violaceusniger TaxID=68280 RepID=A0A0X3VVL5_STRVO|nr:hypothetical protein ADL28_31175 [Streptomyces violaceusniger]
MSAVVTAAEPQWVGLFAGLNGRQFRKLVGLVRRRGGGKPTGGRPWALSLEDRILLVAAYWRTNLTMRQLGPLSGISKSAADRVIGHIAPLLALAPVRRRHPSDTVLIVDGTLVPTRDRSVASSSKNYRYSTNHQVVIDANTRLVVAAGQPLLTRPSRTPSTMQHSRSGTCKIGELKIKVGGVTWSWAHAGCPCWLWSPRPICTIPRRRGKSSSAFGSCAPRSPSSGRIPPTRGGSWAGRKQHLNLTIKPVSRPKDTSGFVILPRRWVVERPLAWIMHARRHARDYERLVQHSETLITWAAITLMTRRLARRKNHPAERRDSTHGHVVAGAA